MDWHKLENIEQIQNLITESEKEAFLIFKHSTRCSISTMAKNRVESNWDLPIKAYYLDLISFRSISSEIENIFNVEHQSPQALLIKNGICVYHASHMNINVKNIQEALNAS